MGSCVSVSENAKLFGTSPVKSKPLGVVSERTIASQFGSKDEAFFDSQPWLDSDCEDDFVSVNGDLTPSRGSTPVHPSHFTAHSQANKDAVVNGNHNSEPSSPDKKKRLSELFKESLRVNPSIREKNEVVNENETPTKVEIEATDETPRPSTANSQGSSDRTPNVTRRRADDESAKSAQCCLPRLLSSRSLSERKKRTSPTHIVG